MQRRSVASLERRAHRREPRKQFFIYCEGANTEPDYFYALAKTCSDSMIRVRPVGGVGVPMTVAERAFSKLEELGLSEGIGKRKKLSSFEEGDEVWAVFDRDKHPRYYEAIAFCKENGMRLGYSNPCFEVWLILHIQDYHNCEDHHQVQKRLKTIHPSYNPHKGKTADCSSLVRKVEVAERRAELQLRARRDECGGRHLGPPHTTVGHLSKSIRKAAEKFKR